MPDSTSDEDCDYPMPPDLVAEHMRRLQFGAPDENRSPRVRSPYDPQLTPEQRAKFFASRDAQRRLRQTRGRGTSARRAPRPRASRRRARRTRAVVHVAASGGDPPGPGPCERAGEGVLARVVRHEGGRGLHAAA